MAGWKFVSNMSWTTNSWIRPTRRAKVDLEDLRNSLLRLCNLGRKIETLQILENATIVNSVLNTKHKWRALCCIENLPKSVDLAWCCLERRWRHQTRRHHVPSFGATGVCPLRVRDKDMGLCASLFPQFEMFYDFSIFNSVWKAWAWWWLARETDNFTLT